MANDNGPDDENVTRQVRAARRTARRHQQRKARLVQTTRTLLEDEGPAALTASKIAKACDLTASALYYYFESLEALFAAVHADLFREELQMAEEALSASEAADVEGDVSPGFAALAAVFRAKIRFGVENPKRWRALYQGAAGISSTSTDLADELVPLSHRFFARMEAALAQDQRAGALDVDVQPRVLANLAFCQAQGVLTMVLAAEAAGTSTLFAPDILVDTALETFRRAWWRSR